MSPGSPKCIPRTERVLKEFIQKLDLGEFDGKLHEALRDLTKEVFRFSVKWRRGVFR